MLKASLTATLIALSVAMTASVAPAAQIFPADGREHLQDQLPFYQQPHQQEPGGLASGIPFPSGGLRRLPWYGHSFNRIMEVP
jgi:hypothetical protein